MISTNITKLAACAMAVGLLTTASLSAFAAEDTSNQQATENKPAIERPAGINGKGKGLSWNSLTEEQQAEKLAAAKEHLAQQLTDGTITQEQYDQCIAAIENGELPKLGMKGNKADLANLTDEQKAEMQTKMKERLAQQLADGSITQEQYDQCITSIDNGELPMKHGRGGKWHGSDTETTADTTAPATANT